MSGLELEYGSIQECINEVQKLSAVYPAAEALMESTAKYLDFVIKGFKEADYKNIEIS